MMFLIIKGIALLVAVLIVYYVVPVLILQAKTIYRLCRVIHMDKCGLFVSLSDKNHPEENETINNSN